MQWPAVFFDDSSSLWRTPLACDACGGYLCELPVRDPGHGVAALVHAQAAADRHSVECLNCDAHRMVSSRGARLVFDTRLPGWVLLGGTVPRGMSLPVGVRLAFHREFAQAAARVLLGNTPVPLRIVEPGAASEADIACVQPTDSGFELFVPCFECEGATVGLEARSVAEAAEEAVEALSWVAAEGCPACTTQAGRAGLRDIWFDTWEGDWMMRTGDSTVALGLGSLAASGEDVEAAIAAARA